MELSESLKDDLYNHIDQLKKWNLSSFEKEEDFIDETVDTLDGFHQRVDGQGAQVKTKKMHPSPKVDFSGPNWDGSIQARDAAEWIDETSAELADIMVVLNRFEGDKVTGRRVMLSQTKFSKNSSTNQWKWKIKMHQYHLLHELPKITFVEPDTGAQFNLNPENRTFTSYSLASDFEHGFFNSTEMAQDFMSSIKGIKSTTYDPTPDAPYGFQVFRGILKRFVLEMYGEEFDIGDEVCNMIQHMYSHASFERSDSVNAIADGGAREDNSPGLAAIQVDVGKEIGEMSFDNIDEEGPRL